MKLYSAAGISRNLKALYRLVGLALILASVIILHGRAGAPVAGATAPIVEAVASPLGNLTSGDAEIDRMIVEAASKHGVDPKLIYFVMKQESQFKVKARSGKDAQGLMQIIPATADRFKIEDPYDPQQNIECGVKYLRWLLKRFNGNVNLALAGYNAGEGNVEKNGNQIPDFKETKDYVQKITKNYGKTYHPVLPPEQARAEFGISEQAAE
jgi:soluble lytic murein transglycosylase-like protein